MAGNYGPEVKASMQNPTKRPSQIKKGSESPADKLRDQRRGIKEGSAQDLKLDAQPANQAPPAQTMPPQAQDGPPSGGLHPAHAAMAASIAHAILGRGGM